MTSYELAIIFVGLFFAVLMLIELLEEDEKNESFDMGQKRTKENRH